MDFDAFDSTLLQQWVGKTELRRDVIDCRPAAALAATLDRTIDFHSGAVLPPLWHWIYFHSPEPQSAIGSDGHVKRGGFLPPISLPRRMWAGGRLQFIAPLPLNAAASRRSRILRVESKGGRSGDLAFVTVQHEIFCDDAPVLVEEHDIAYCELPQPGVEAAAPELAPKDAVWTRQVTPDPVLLFRYSALTFNGHRIHYDRSYATAVEAYPGLIVHGPLVATLLIDLLREHMPAAELAAFDFRAIAPLFDFEPFFVCCQPDEEGAVMKLWARNIHGELAMQAEAILVPHGRC